MDVYNGNFVLKKIPANGIMINVAISGNGPALLLLHGWPHTWEVWNDVMPVLANSYTVIAPDLRGLGGSTKAAEGYDLFTLADDAVALLNALGTESASVVGIDLGVQIAWMLSVRHPQRVRKLAVMEGILGTLPGAENFLSKGPPWWFGFHAVPGLAETVLEGNEAAYIDWFLKAGTKDRVGLAPKVRQAFINAYSNREAMRCGFEHYRAFPKDAEQINKMAAGDRSKRPIFAIAGGVVCDALAHQLAGISANLIVERIEDCAHIIPLEQPAALVAHLSKFLSDEDQKGNL